MAARPDALASFFHLPATGQWRTATSRRAMFARLLAIGALGFAAAGAASGIHFNVRADTVAPASLVPPQPPLVWNRSAEEIVRLSADAAAKCREVVDAIALLPPVDGNFTSVSVCLTVTGLQLTLGLGVCCTRARYHAIRQRMGSILVLWQCIPL